MTSNKKNLGILFGGKSPEHPISLISARNIYANADPDHFNTFLIFIDKDGKWFEINEKQFLSDNIKTTEAQGLIIDLSNSQGVFKRKSDGSTIHFDVIFPVIHGRNGEDGNIQGFLNILNIPFVGPDIFASAVCMDKVTTKKILTEAGLSVSKYFCVNKGNLDKLNYFKIVKYTGLPVVVKPSRAGSSVGISKVKNIEGIKTAIELAMQYDNKVLIEEYIDGREVECAVLGNKAPAASVIGEIIVDFYDYEAKYSSNSKAELKAPASLARDLSKALKETAIKAYKATECEGMSRVDFFLRGSEIIVNEINTIPGFTNISMYPKLFELTGIPNKQLIIILTDLAVERFEENRQMKTNLSE
jgi:D-alanine-D-alanine ligase